jgi:hypothetical protein
MEAIQSRARLANGASNRSAARPAVPVRRADAEAALRAGGPVELTFDVVRRGDTAGRTVNLEWEPAELEALLDSASGDEFALVFDPLELERAIEDPDVEAQGMREKAAVLTVAIAALGAAGGASATPYGPGTASQAAGASGSGYVVPAGGAEALVSDTASASAGASGSGYVVPAGGAEAFVSDVASGGASGTGYVMPAGGTEAIVAEAGAAGASGSGYVVPAGSSEAIVADAGTASVSAGSGASLSSGESAAIAGGVALLITGAGFAAMKSRRRDAGPQPA